METVWERRRLKRETLEPEEMHTVREGEQCPDLVRSPGRACQTRLSLCPLSHSGSHAHWSGHTGLDHGFTAVYRVHLPETCFCPSACSSRCLGTRQSTE